MRSGRGITGITFDIANTWLCKTWLCLSHSHNKRIGKNLNLRESTYVD